MKLRIPALLVGATLALAACNDSTGSDRRGDFDGTVRGEFSINVDGDAESGNTPGFGQDQILLTDVSEDVTIFAFHSDTEFSEGSEALAGITQEDGIFAGIYIGNRAFYADGGIIDIDELTSGGIRGSMRFTAIEVDEDANLILDDEVTVDVDFNTDYDSNCCFNRAPAARIRINKVPVR